MPNENNELTQAEYEKLRKGIHVHVVEDQKFPRDLLWSGLSQYFKASTSANGEDAIEFYKKEMPDIVLLDINLPGIDGYTVLKKILELNSHAFIIMVTADSQVESVTKAVKEGAKGYVVKPFTIKHIDDYVKKYIIETIKQKKM